MADVNMDIRKNPTATVPIFEFKVPKSEIQTDLEMGEIGSLIVPVEVVANSNDAYTFRKRDIITTESSFRKETSKEMGTRLMKAQKEAGIEE